METNIPVKNDDLDLPVNSYEPPVIEVIGFTLEKGFAASTTDWNPGAW